MKHGHEEEEEGFIASQIEVKSKNAHKVIESNHVSRAQIDMDRKLDVYYRFTDGLMKKEPAESYITPLSYEIKNQSPPQQTEKRKQRIDSWEHPFNFYCVTNEYKLCYSRASNDPIAQGTEYIKNIVSLTHIEDKRNPSNKLLKNFELEDIKVQGDELVLDSKFESGNLHCAFRKGVFHQYHLFIENDTNTLGYNQWFYFSVRSTKPKTKYTFKIVNFKKVIEFYKNGYKPMVFSQKTAKSTGNGWYRAGSNISFQENTIRADQNFKLFTLKFELQFDYQNDFVMISAGLPYSYSKLMHDLRELQSQASSNKDIKFTIDQNIKSICMNTVPQVTIKAANPDQSKERKMIIFLARQHPGETWPSYLMFGVMKALISQLPQIKYLLETCIFKIYPMINVDGVIYGNFRCDLTGMDLNRRWKDPSKIFHPQVYEIKRKVTHYAKKYKVQCCFDLHGHSKKYNIFCYSCKSNMYTCRILPYLIQNQNPIFQFSSCTFGITSDKETTARATINKIIKNENVLTIQTSYYGSKINKEIEHFHPKDIYKMSESILISVRYFLDKGSKKLQNVENVIKDNIKSILDYDKANEDESGSESDPQVDEIDFKIKCQNIFDKKYESESKFFQKEIGSNQIHQTNLEFNDRKGQMWKLEEDLVNHSLGKQRSIRIQKPVRQYSSRQYASELQSNEVVKISYLKPNKKKSEKLEKQESKQKQKQKEKQTISFNRPIQQSQIKLQKQRSKTPIKTNLRFRDKKKLAIVHDSSKIFIDGIVGKSKSSQIKKQPYSKQFNQLRKQQVEQAEKNQIQGFINKFQKFIPMSFSHRNKAHLDMIQEGLNNDNPMNQLQLLMENKRRIQLQRMKREIQESTNIAERQGKIRSTTTKRDQVVDYRRFKDNQRIKMQIRRISEIQGRYFSDQK